jgi:hypothetical protein
MIVSSYLSPRFPVMRVVWAASVLIWMTFMGTSSLSDGYMRGELKGSWSYAPKPTVSSCAAAYTWSLSSAEMPAERSPRTLMTPLGDGIFKSSYRSGQ